MNIIYVINDFYKDNNDLEEIIYPKENGNDRPYYFLSIKYKDNNIFVPLRSNLPDFKKAGGKIGYPVPSNKRPNAGFDFRKLLIINDLEYIKTDRYIKVAPSQQRIIRANKSTIETQVIDYIKGYEKSFKKNRTKRDNKYVYSSLCNYHEELALE